jgi:hypothetical protein
VTTSRCQHKGGAAVLGSFKGTSPSQAFELPIIFSDDSFIDVKLERQPQIDGLVTRFC